MELVTLQEFMDLTRLDAKSVLLMLEDGELTFERGELGELLIDISNLSPTDIASRGKYKLRTDTETSSALLEETVASEIVNAMESMIEEALQIATSWNDKQNRS